MYVDYQTLAQSCASDGHGHAIFLNGVYSYVQQLLTCIL